MSKKKTAQNPEQPQQPAYIAELLEKGTVTLTATDREAFGDITATIPAETRYAAGAVGKDTLTGLYELRIDLVTND